MIAHALQQSYPEAIHDFHHETDEAIRELGGLAAAPLLWLPYLTLLRIGFAVPLSSPRER